MVAEFHTSCGKQTESVRFPHLLVMVGHSVRFSSFRTPGSSYSFQPLLQKRKNFRKTVSGTLKTTKRSTFTEKIIKSVSVIFQKSRPHYMSFRQGKHFFWTPDISHSFWRLFQKENFLKQTVSGTLKTIKRSTFTEKIIKIVSVIFQKSCPHYTSLRQGKHFFWTPDISQSFWRLFQKEKFFETKGFWSLEDH